MGDRALMVPSTSDVVVVAVEVDGWSRIELPDLPLLLSRCRLLKWFTTVGEPERDWEADFRRTWLVWRMAASTLASGVPAGPQTTTRPDPCRGLELPDARDVEALAELCGPVLGISDELDCVSGREGRSLLTSDSGSEAEIPRQDALVLSENCFEPSTPREKE